MRRQSAEWILLIVLGVFLVSRSSLDVFAHTYLVGGPWRLNVQAGAALALIVAVIAFELFRWFRSGRLSLPPLSVAFGLMLIALIPWVVLAFLRFGGQGLMGAREWVRFLGLLAVFVATYRSVRSFGPRPVLWCMFASLAYPLILTAYQLLSGNGKMVAGLLRFPGTFHHPNPFGFYLVLMMGLTIWRQEYDCKRRLLWLLLLAAEGGALVATLSIGAMIVMCLMTLILTLAGPRGIRRVALITCVACLALYALVPAGQYRVIRQWHMFTHGSDYDSAPRQATVRLAHCNQAPASNRLARSPFVFDASDGGAEIQVVKARLGSKRTYPITSFQWRLNYWAKLLAQWSERPWFGSGFHTTTLATASAGGAGRRPDPHNDYLKFLVETGVVGSAIWWVFLGYVVLSVSRWRRDLHSASLRSLHLVAMGSLMWWLVGSAAENMLAGFGYQCYLWTLIGIIAASREPRTQNSNNEAAHN